MTGRARISRALGMAPWPAWGVLGVWALWLGFAGLRAGHVGLVGRLLSTGGLADPQAPNPLIETLWKALLHLGAGGESWVVIWGTNVAGLVLTLGLFFGFLRREAGAPWAHLGTLCVALHPWVVGECATLGGTFIATAGMLGVVRALEVKRWWGTPLVWGIGGVLLACWPPMLMWAAMLWVMALGVESQPGTGQRGTMASAWLPLSLVGAPVCVPLVAHLLHPGVWADPKDGWGQLLQAAWLPQLQGAWWQGQWWPDGHLTWWSGVPLIAAGTGLITLVLALLGGLWTRRTLCDWVPLVGLASVVGLCWVLPQGVSGVVDATATVPLWVGWLVARAGARLDEAGVFGGLRARAKHAVFWAVILGPLALATASHREYAASWRSVFGDDLARGQVLLERDTLVPLGLLEQNSPPPLIWAPGPLREQLKAMTSLHPGAQVTGQAEANVWIERVVPSAPEDTATVELTGLRDPHKVLVSGPGRAVFYRVVVPKP